MADRTPRFKLTTLERSTEDLSFENYKLSGADRILLDRLLRYAVENHTHTAAAVTITPPIAPTLSPLRSGGSIPANRAVHYCYSIVDARGQESIASQVATAYTPSQVSAPLAGPRLTATTGSLDGGDYLYAVTACSNTGTQETLASPTAAGSLGGFGGFVVQMPSVPSGASFFNIYRKGPRDDELGYLTAVDSEFSQFTDNGSLTASHFRRTPQANTTFSANAVTVELPSPTPEGSWTWRLYRTYDPSRWENSLLDWIGPIDTYLDDGRPTRAGLPPRSSAAVGGAPKIALDSATTGQPPPGILTTTRIANFAQTDVIVGAANWNWVCEYEQADLSSMRATLGRECPPAAQDVMVGLDIHTGSTWEPVTEASSPVLSVIPVGETIGTLADLSDALPNVTLNPGDRLRSRVYQAGGGATPTDRDLALTIMLRVRHGSSTQSYQWETV